MSGHPGEPIELPVVGADDRGGLRTGIGDELVRDPLALLVAEPCQIRGVDHRGRPLLAVLDHTKLRGRKSPKTYP